MNPQCDLLTSRVSSLITSMPMFLVSSLQECPVEINVKRRNDELQTVKKSSKISVTRLCSVILNQNDDPKQSDLSPIRSSRRLNWCEKKNKHANALATPGSAWSSLSKSGDKTDDYVYMPASCFMS